ncbi:MAG: response regulator transcription factor [Bacteroidales bacterium]|nr:response regulator transcription factor [Bacteroidales bacterium]
MIRTIIIDDEMQGRKTLRNFINKYCSNVEIVGEAESVKEGLEAIILNSPDLILLDINLPDGTGFDLLEKLPKMDFKVIFVTAYNQHAIKAFKYSAIDYILKPIDPDLLVEAISKVKKDDRLSEIEKKLEALLSNRKSVEKLALPSSNGILLVKIDDIIRCESDSNYTNIFLQNKQKILVTKTLKDYDDILSDVGFFRVHKSHLINLRFVKQYIKGEGGYVIMEDNSQVEVSRRRKDEFIMALKSI